MKVKGFLSGMITLVLLGTILAACGNNSNNGGNAGNAASDPGTTTNTNANSPSDSSTGKKDLVMNYRADPPALDVSIAEAAATFTILGAISEGLYRLDKDMQPQPALAESMPEISADGLTYTIKLRSGLVWADGSPLTANDFVYSYRRTLDPNTKATYAFMLAWIKGGNDVLNSKTPEDIEANKQKLGVQAKDDTTLVITLDHPIPFFTAQLAFLNFYPQNEKFVEAQGDKSGADADKVLGAGPFKLTSWNHEQSLVLEKNDKYWDAANVKLDKVTLNIVKDTNTGLNLYETGETDYADVKGDQMKAYDGKPDLQMKKELVTGYLNFQQTKVPAFANLKVRQAFSMAVDLKGVTDLVLINGSVPATGFVPAGNQDGNGKEFRGVVGDTRDAFDAAKAKTLLQEGLAESGTTLPKLSIIGDDTETGKKLLEYIVQQWKTNLGVDVVAEPLPHANRLDRELSKNYTIVSTLWGADYNDPMTWLDMFLTGGSLNTQDWSNADYDKLIKDAQIQTDLAKRADEMVQAEKILMSEAAVMPLYFRSSPFVINPKLKDLILPPYGPDFELKWAHFEG
ncbi:peptide ABC transporter substrate-binding protein [Paenibacillus sepulcri]|uniref:Peptide ABC transporter substrate-binding protein n=1 Tax=Paenibacillus sepulcri TaxID=359917 RepID=A0ABS7C464_9BACL|nr:peptide ABC transporter substrate-binding protein [Paenibacillus sepulcri]